MVGDGRDAVAVVFGVFFLGGGGGGGIQPSPKEGLIYSERKQLMQHYILKTCTLNI